jgi:hypothetical protein
VVQQALERRWGTALTTRGRLVLGAKVDVIFASSRFAAVADAEEIERLWEDVFA